MSEETVEEVKKELDGQDLKEAFSVALNYLESRVEEINTLNVFPVPDGDTGTNMYLTFKAAVQGMIEKDYKSIEKITEIAAEKALLGARGNSGVIISQILRGLARGLKGKETATPMDFAKAFQYGVVFAYRAVSKPVEGTVLTVAREMAKGTKKVSRENKSSRKLFEEAVTSGYKAVEKTKEQLPVLAKAGVVDAGGLGLVVIVEGCFMALSGEDGFSRTLSFEKQPSELKEVTTGERSEFIFPYCTELIIKGSNIGHHRLRRDLGVLGDSLVVVGDKNVTKVHIHTNQPGEVLDYCIKRGTLHEIKIDNMLDQHEERLELEEDGTAPLLQESGNVNVLAVCNGKGLREIFKGFQVTRIIEGGPTLNPKVQDFVEAMQGVESGFIILPNDKNIRLAAEQAAQYLNKEVHVIPTQNIPQGIAAATAFNPNQGIHENLENMTEAYSSIKSGEITFAVREGSFENISFNKGDIIGLYDHKITVAGDDVKIVLFELLSQMVDDENELITIFYGQDINDKEIEEISEALAKEFPEKEVEMYSGGQPLYYFLISVE